MVAIGSDYAVETAQRVQFSCAGTVDGIWWYRTPQDTGTNTVTAWRGTTVVAQAAANPGGTGWVYIAFASPFAVTNTDKVLVGVHHPNGAYATRVSGFTNRTITSPSGCMTAGPTTSAAPTGLYKYSQTPAIPDLSYDASEYFISPDFTIGTQPPPTTTTTTTTPAPTGHAQLYAATVTPPETVAIGSAYAVETAQRINFSCNGQVNGIWWYRTPQDTGTNTVTAWRGTTLVAQSAGNPAGNGWVYLPFTTPVTVTIGDQLLLGVHHPNGAYGSRLLGFANRSVNAGCLTAPASTTTAKNGYYAYTATAAFPILSYDASEYFVSPDFTET